MTELERAYEEASTTGRDVVALMQAIRVLLGRGQARIRAFMLRGDDRDAQALRELARGVCEDYEVSLALGKVTKEMVQRLALAIQSAGVGLGAAPAAGSDEVARLWAECDRTIDSLASVDASVRVMEMHAAQSLSALLEASNAREAAPDALAVFDRLLERLRTH